MNRMSVGFRISGPRPSGSGLHSRPCESPISYAPSRKSRRARPAGRATSAKRFVHQVAVGAIALTGLTVPSSAQHQDLFVGHSPPDKSAPPGQTCPTLEPLKLFIADNAAVGGAVPPGGGDPAIPGALITLTPVAFNANLADPARGGFIFAGSQPGMNYIGVGNLCHGMSTSFTGGRFFETYFQRTASSDGVNFGMTQNVTPILVEDGDAWKFGDSTNGGHTHAFFLAHRAGGYFSEFRVTASAGFLPGDPFTLRFRTDPECTAPIPVDLTDVFNADVIDSDALDAPLSFDGAGHSWLLNGQYGTDRGIPVDGRLDEFQLGGPEAAGLTGAHPNCLFDNGIQSAATAVDLTQAGLDGQYLAVELLVGASGDFACLTGQVCEKLVMRLIYAAGAEHIVNVRRLALPVGFDPVYVPLNDWGVTDDPPPLLAVGPGGRREGGGFARSNGAGVDTSIVPADSFYLQRVTIPLDAMRILRTIAFDDYVDGGRVGIFGVTLIEPDVCRDCDFDEDDDVDLFDFAEFDGCATNEGIPYRDDECIFFDIDRDGDVDLHDAAGFQVLFDADVQ